METKRCLLLIFLHSFCSWNNCFIGNCFRILVQSLIQHELKWLGNCNTSSTAGRLKQNIITCTNKYSTCQSLQQLAALSPLLKSFATVEENCLG